MSRAREALERYLRDLDTGKEPVWARKTEFTPQQDGSMRRLITRRDGTVEKDEIIPAKRWALTAARAHTGLSQAEFAKLLGVSKRTLQEWEQGRKEPSGPARLLLKIVIRHPEVLRETLSP